MSTGIRYKFIENTTASALIPGDIPFGDGEDRQIKVFVRLLSAVDIGTTPGKTRDLDQLGGCLVGVVDNIDDVLMIEGTSYWRQTNVTAFNGRVTDFELVDNGNTAVDDSAQSSIRYLLTESGQIRVLDLSPDADATSHLAAGDLIVVKVYMGAKYPGTKFQAFDRV